MDYVDFAEELMKKMVSIPSESQNEEELAVYLCEYLANIGMKAKLQRIEGKSCNVVAKLSGNNTGTRKLLMGGHIDTVTADEIGPLTLYRSEKLLTNILVWAAEI